MSVAGFVFARGGSKGVPNKNLRKLGGESLVARAVRHARCAASLGFVGISTDSAEIAAEARDAGARVPFMRPAELAADTSAEIDAWRHAIEHLRHDGHRVDVLVSVPPTAPLRDPARIDAVVARLRESSADVVVCGFRSSRNPYFNMVELDDRGLASVSKPTPTSISRRQDAPAVYSLTTVAYAARADYVLETPRLLDGDVALVEVSEVEAVDVDTELDLSLAEFLLSKGIGE